MTNILVFIPLLLEEAGMNFSSVLLASLLAGSLATAVMGLVANYPFALFPGIASSNVTLFVTIGIITD